MDNSFASCACSTEVHPDSNPQPNLLCRKSSCRLRLSFEFMLISLKFRVEMFKDFSLEGVEKVFGMLSMVFFQEKRK